MIVVELDLPGFLRKRLERECEDAEHPKGMSVHDGRTRIHAADIRYLLALIDKLTAAPAVAQAPLAANDPNTLTALRQSWADRCGISYDDDRAEEPHLYGWPDKFAIYRDGWDAACLYVRPTQDAVAQEPVREVIEWNLNGITAKAVTNISDLPAGTKLDTAPQSASMEAMATEVGTKPRSR